MSHLLFVDVGVVIVIAGALSLFAYRLRQPLIIAYIVTGLIVGPGLLNIVGTEEMLAGLAQFGIAFLLFIVGLNLNWRAIHEVGRPALLGGLSQVVITSLVGFFIGRALGFDDPTSLFLGIAFAFSSTIIIVKLLTDKEDLDRLYGRVAVGMLIVQDVIAMFLLLGVGALREGGDIATALSETMVKGVIVLGALAVLSHVVVPLLMRYVARSQELLFLTALAWCFGIASLLYFLGFGIEIGALLAGISLAGTGFRHEIEAKIRGLRDFFLVIFFIVLGTHLTFDSVATLWVPALAMSAYVLVGNPIIAAIIMRFLGYHPRTAFHTGLTVAQISEFSFIFLAGGIAIGWVTDDVLPLATIVALVTIAVSSYMIQYNEWLYDVLARLVPWTSRHRRDNELRSDAPDIVLLGYERMGASVLPELQAMSDNLLVVDFNPTVIERLAHDGVPAMYGDAGSEDVLHFVRAEDAQLVVSTIPDMAVNYDVLDYLRDRRSRATAIVTVKNGDDAAKCYALGAAYVIIPSVLGGEAFGAYIKTRKAKRATWATLARRQGFRVK